MRATFEGPSPDSSAADSPSPAAPSSEPQGLRATGIEHVASSRPKYKTRPSSKVKGKGKGKATRWGSDDGSDDDDDDDDAYVTSNDYGAPRMNGDTGFGEVGGDDEEELYG